MYKKWYLADLLEENHLANEDTSILYVNTILVNADDAEQAYTKALQFGQESSYDDRNTDGVVIHVRFRGIQELTEIYEDLEDGAEIAYSRYEDVDESEIQRRITPKEQLNVFRPRDEV